MGPVCAPRPPRRTHQPLVVAEPAPPTLCVGDFDELFGGPEAFRGGGAGPGRASKSGATSGATSGGAPLPVVVKASDATVTAVLGPTNTGKTHYAIERMLGYETGVFGFPLRLLAREVYDRVVGMRGADCVALVTGEERIIPPRARYYLCTVEAMPLDWGADFLAVDEIQLCADPERGHVFTHRLLNARGRKETLFLGAATMRERFAQLAPGARIVARDRLSSLTYTGSKKLSRLPARTAVVAFSADAVYAIAELIRRQKGGAAVVMGALSPRTRNAQVALYQEGDVDFLVATDAIGMGLNLDVNHVAFAGLRKFDGRRSRYLEPQELAQIAGRAGRHLNDGGFGVTGEAPPLDPEVASAIEEHRFKPAGKLQWRNAELDFATPFNLLLSLERTPPNPHLARAREADDIIALRTLLRDAALADSVSGASAVRRLWDACQLPDFRKNLPSEHAALVAQIHQYLSTGPGVIPEDWLAKQCERLDRDAGDIDALSRRLAYIRTWTYVANRPHWLADPQHWRGVTRAIEDKLSDALHERLTQAFVDRRTSVLARRLKQKEKLLATVDAQGEVTVEGEFVGRLEGFRFQADPSAEGAEGRLLQSASAAALGAELERRVESFYKAADAEIDVTEQGGLMWGASAVGRLESNAHNGDPLAVRAIGFADDLIEPPLKEKIERRLQFWIDSKIRTVFAPLLALRDDPEVTGLARGMAFQLLERFGVAPRTEVGEDVKALDQASRGMLRKHGVRFGQHTVFMPVLLKPAPTRFRLLLWALRERLDEFPSAPPPGHVTIPLTPGAPEGYYAMAGYRQCGERALRLDMLERLADMIRPLDQRGGFEATAEMLSITGASLEQFAALMQGLGFEAERGERPKPPKAPKAAPQDAAQEASAQEDSAQEDASPEETERGETEKGETGPDAAAEGVAAEPAATEAVGAETPAAETTASETPPSETPTAEAQSAAPTESGAVAEAPPAEPASAEPELAEAEPAESEPAESLAVSDEGASDEGASGPDAPASEPGETLAAPEAPDADPDVEAEAGAEAPSPQGAETEVFFLFRYAPRRRGDRRRGPRAEARGDGGRGDGARGDGPAGRQGGEAEGDGGPRRNRRRRDGAPGGAGEPGGDGQRGARAGGRKPGGKGKGGEGKGGDEERGKGRGPRGKGPRRDGDGGKPRVHSAGPNNGSGGGRRRELDPDSPFAVLQRLKDRQ